MSEPTTTGDGTVVGLSYWPDGRLALAHVTDDAKEGFVLCGASGATPIEPQPENPPVCPSCHNALVTRLIEGIFEAGVALYKASTGVAPPEEEASGVPE